MNKSRIRAMPGSTALGRNGTDVPTDRVLPRLLQLLVTAVARVRVDDVQTSEQGRDSANVWKDEAYAYLEADVPGMPPDAEFDLYVGNGRAFVRIKLEEHDEPTISLLKPSSQENG